MGRGARRHAARDGTAIDDNDRASALAQLISGREARDAAADDSNVALFVFLQGNGLRGDGNGHPKRFTGHGSLTSNAEKRAFRPAVPWQPENA